MTTVYTRMMFTKDIYFSGKVLYNTTGLHANFVKFSKLLFYQSFRIMQGEMQSNNLKTNLLLDFLREKTIRHLIKESIGIMDFIKQKLTVHLVKSQNLAS